MLGRASKSGQWPNPARRVRSICRITLEALDRPCLRLQGRRQPKKKWPRIGSPLFASQTPAPPRSQQRPPALFLGGDWGSSRPIRGGSRPFWALVVEARCPTEGFQSLPHRQKLPVQAHFVGGRPVPSLWCTSINPFNPTDPTHEFGRIDSTTQSSPHPVQSLAFQTAISNGGRGEHHRTHVLAPLSPRTPPFSKLF